MTKLSSCILKTYNISPVIIAFVDGSIISAAINLLTSIKSYQGCLKWVAVAASLILIVDAILLLVWQNAADKLQKAYKPWVEFIEIQNKISNLPNQQKSVDWIAFVKRCNEKCDSTAVVVGMQSKEPDLPKYSIKRLVLYPTFSCILLLLGLGLMVCLFI